MDGVDDVDGWLKVRSFLRDVWEGVEAVGAAVRQARPWTLPTDESRRWRSFLFYGLKHGALPHAGMGWAFGPEAADCVARQHDRRRWVWDNPDHARHHWKKMADGKCGFPRLAENMGGGETGRGVSTLRSATEDGRVLPNATGW